MCNHKNATVVYVDKIGITRCDQCCRHTFTEYNGCYFCYRCGSVDTERTVYRSADYNFFRKGKTKCGHCNKHFSDGGYLLCSRCRFGKVTFNYPNLNADYNSFRQVENINDVPTAWLKHLKKTRDILDKKLTKIWIKKGLINKI